MRREKPARFVFLGFPFRNPGKNTCNPDSRLPGKTAYLCTIISKRQIYLFMVLENINSPEDVKKLSLEELNLLSGEMREVLLHRLSNHGGHFGPNFGMVEATIALHYVFNSPEDKMVFDVSPQDADRTERGLSQSGKIRRRVGLLRAVGKRTRPFRHRPYLHLGQPGRRTGQRP